MGQTKKSIKLFLIAIMVIFFIIISGLIFNEVFAIGGQSKVWWEQAFYNKDVELDATFAAADSSTIKIMKDGTSFKIVIYDSVGTKIFDFRTLGYLEVRNGILSTQDLSITTTAADKDIIIDPNSAGNGLVQFGGSSDTDTLTLYSLITSDQTYATATTPIYLRTSLTATSGTHNNVRIRGQNQAVGASTSDLRGLYAQATTTASKYGGSSTAIYANAIAKNASTTTNLRGILIDTESEGTPTAIANMYGLYIRNKSTVAITTDNYSMVIDNEKMGSGIVQDAGIQLKTTTWGSGVTAWTYGIDMNQTGAFGTADIRFQNGALINNSTSDLLTITEATVDITGTITEGGNAVYNSTETPGGILGNTWAAPTIDKDGINDTHIDWGTGANQVSLKDIEATPSRFFTFRVDTANGLAADTSLVFYNDFGASITIDSIRAISDQDDYAINIIEINQTGGGNTLIDALVCAADGVEWYTDIETTITGATVEAEHYIGFARPASTGTTVTITIYFHYTRP